MDMDKNVLLVKAIEKFPCLYKNDSKKYSRLAFTEPAWNEVSKEINLPVHECKEKWKNLRYGLLRSLRRTENGIVKKRYYLHEEMKYLIPYVGTTPSNVKKKNETERIDFRDEDLENPFDSNVFEMNVAESYTDEEEPIEKKPKTYEITYNQGEQEISHFSQSTQQPIEEDARRMFLLSLLPEIADFSENQMKMFRRKIFKILDEINEMDPL